MHVSLKHTKHVGCFLGLGECALPRLYNNREPARLKESKGLLHAELCKKRIEELLRLAVRRKEYMRVEFGIRDIAPPTARDTQFFSDFSILLEDEHALTALGRPSGRHKPRCAASDHDKVKLRFNK